MNGFQPIEVGGRYAKHTDTDEVDGASSFFPPTHTYLQNAKQNAAQQQQQVSKEEAQIDETSTPSFR